MFLEIHSVSQHHDGRSLLHDVVMCEAWENEDLSTKSNIKLRISVDRDHHAEKRIKIDVGADGELYGELWNHDMTKALRRLPVTRLDDRSVRVRFKVNMIRRGLQRYDWQAMAVAHGCETPAVGVPNHSLYGYRRCWDYVPPGGKFRHVLD